MPDEPPTKKQERDAFERSLKAVTNQTPTQFREELIRFNRVQTEAAVARRPDPEIPQTPTMPVVREFSLKPNPIKLDVGGNSNGSPTSTLNGIAVVVTGSLNGVPAYGSAFFQVAPTPL